MRLFRTTCMAIDASVLMPLHNLTQYETLCMSKMNVID